MASRSIAATTGVRFFAVFLLAAASSSPMALSLAPVPMPIRSRRFVATPSSRDSRTTTTLVTTRMTKSPLGNFPKLPNPFGGFGEDDKDEEGSSVVSPLPPTALPPNFDATNAESLFARTRSILASDLLVSPNCAPLLSDDFAYVGPNVFETGVLSKEEYLAACRYFDVRRAFPDLDYRPHDFRLVVPSGGGDNVVDDAAAESSFASSSESYTVRCTIRTVGTMRGPLRLRNNPTEPLPPNGARMICPPESITVTFDPISGLVTRLVSGMTMDRLVGNTAGLTGVAGAAVVAGVSPNEWEIYPPVSVVRRFFGRPVKQLTDADGSGGADGGVLSPFPESVMVQLTKGVIAANNGLNDPDLLSDDFTYCGPFVGPLNKDNYVQFFTSTVGLHEVMVDVDGGYTNFRVDVYDPYRVWVDASPSTSGSTPAAAASTTKLRYVAPPQALSFTFDDEGYCTRFTSGYVLDPLQGNTGGLGGVYGLAYAAGMPMNPFATRTMPVILTRLQKRALQPFTGVGVDEYVLPKTKGDSDEEEEGKRDVVSVAPPAREGMTTTTTTTRGSEEGPTPIVGAAAATTSAPKAIPATTMQPPPPLSRPKPPSPPPPKPTTAEGKEAVAQKGRGRPTIPLISFPGGGGGGGGGGKKGPSKAASPPRAAATTAKAEMTEKKTTPPAAAEVKGDGRPTLPLLSFPGGGKKAPSTPPPAAATTTATASQKKKPSPPPEPQAKGRPTLSLLSFPGGGGGGKKAPSPSSPPPPTTTKKKTTTPTKTEQQAKGRPTLSLLSFPLGGEGEKAPSPTTTGKTTATKRGGLSSAKVPISESPPDPVTEALSSFFGTLTTPQSTTNKGRMARPSTTTRSNNAAAAEAAVATAKKRAADLKKKKDDEAKAKLEAARAAKRRKDKEARAKRDEAKKKREDEARAEREAIQAAKLKRDEEARARREEEARAKREAAAAAKRQREEEARERKVEAKKRKEDEVRRRAAAAEEKAAAAQRKREDEAERRRTLAIQKQEQLEARQAASAAAAEAQKRRAEEAMRAKDAEKAKRADQMKAERAMAKAKPGATISLFGFGQKQVANEPSPAPSKLMARAAIPPRKASAAPKGVPTLSQWRRNRDGSVTGLISGSPSYREGESVTTSPLEADAMGGSVVRTKSGSRYFLEVQAEAKRSGTISLFGFGAKAATSASEKAAGEGPRGKAAEATKKQREEVARAKRKPVAVSRASTMKVSAFRASTMKARGGSLGKGSAPKGVPTLLRWRKNRDGSLTGLITGSGTFEDRERITTSPIASGDFESGSVVQTKSGSKYFLG